MGTQPDEYSDFEYEAIQEIGVMVIEYAESLFENAGCPDDFCIQSVSSFSVVFGGVNRLIWSPIRGFRCDTSYCTQKFIDTLKKYHGVK
jgi:hypothetical protein